MTVATHARESNTRSINYRERPRVRNGSAVQNVCSNVLFLILWFICVMFARIACLFGIYSYIIGVFWQRVALEVV